MSELIKKLSDYGVVRTCKQVHDDVVTVVITDGFSVNMKKTMEVMSLITEAFPDHPNVETCITEENFCCVVLNKGKYKDG